MATFTNITDQDLEVRIDGRSITAVAATEDSPAPPFTVPDEFISQLAHQPHYVPADDETQAAVEAYVKSFEPVEEEPETVKPPKADKRTAPADITAPTEEKN